MDAGPAAAGAALPEAGRAGLLRRRDRRRRQGRRERSARHAADLGCRRPRVAEREQSLEPGVHGVRPLRREPDHRELRRREGLGSRGRPAAYRAAGVGQQHDREPAFAGRRGALQLRAQRAARVSGGLRSADLRGRRPSAARQRHGLLARWPPPRDGGHRWPHRALGAAAAAGLRIPARAGQSGHLRQRPHRRRRGRLQPRRPVRRHRGDRRRGEALGRGEPCAAAELRGSRPGVGRRARLQPRRSYARRRRRQRRHLPLVRAGRGAAADDRHARRRPAVARVLGRRPPRRRLDRPSQRPLGTRRRPVARRLEARLRVGAGAVAGRSADGRRHRRRAGPASHR